MLRYLLLALLLWMPAAAMSADSSQQVARVINGKSFVLESGDTVRLAAIQVPNVKEEDTPERKGRPGEPLGDEAKNALEQLVAGRTITLHMAKDSRDRHNRLLGQAYVDGVWLQEALLKTGYAMVYSFSDTPPELVRRMLAAEKVAREAKAGIWAHPYFRIITPAEAGEFLNRFRLVEGKVESVRRVRGNIYINFYKDWRGKFHVFIGKSHLGTFPAFTPESLEGKTIRVRGWINFARAPSISLSHPAQIEQP